MINSDRWTKAHLTRHHLARCSAALVEHWTINIVRSVRKEIKFVRSFPFPVDGHTSLTAWLIIGRVCSVCRRFVMVIELRRSRHRSSIDMMLDIFLDRLPVTVLFPQRLPRIGLRMTPHVSKGPVLTPFLSGNFHWFNVPWSSRQEACIAVLRSGRHYIGSVWSVCFSPEITRLW